MLHSGNFLPALVGPSEFELFRMFARWLISLDGERHRLMRRAFGGRFAHARSPRRRARRRRRWRRTPARARCVRGCFAEQDDLLGAEPFRCDHAAEADGAVADDRDRAAWRDPGRDGGVMARSHKARRPLGARVRRGRAAVVTALEIARPGGAIGRVGVPEHDTTPTSLAFWKNASMAGGPAPVRAYIDQLLPDVLEGRIEPGRVFDRTGTVDEVPAGYRAMSDRDVLKFQIAL